jgi:hypothetical protein
MLISWVVFPLVLCIVALGCALLLELASGVRLKGTLLLPAGLAVIVVVGLFSTMSDATAEWTAPAVVLMAVAGLVLSPPWARGRIDVGALACAVAVFAVYAAPVVLSGETTFASFLPQVDTGTWFGLTDHIMDHGRSIASLEGSNYKDLLEATLSVGYPIGSLVPLGVGRDLVGQDTAWVFQPYLAFLAAMLALSLYELSAQVLPSLRRRAVTVFIASQPALLVGVSLWGGIKEVSAAWVLALLAALVVPSVREGWRERALIPVAVASAAVLGILSFAGALWMMPFLIGAAVLSARLHGRGVALGQAGVALGLTLLLAIPTLAETGSFWDQVTSPVITGEAQSTLLHPLSWRQVFGIWPAGDFRTDPYAGGITDVLVVLVIIAAVAGLVWAWRGRRWELVLYAGGLGAACVLITALGSPWVDAKALAITSPAIVIAALAGLLGLGPDEGPRAAYAPIYRWGLPIAAAAIAGGVLWSNALAYHDVTLAPRAQLHELEVIGDKFADQGPTLLSDFDPYASRHFLRNMDVHGTSGLRPFRIPAADGRHYDQRVGDFRVETEGFYIPSLLGYRTIVRRQTPAASHPSSAFRLAWSGRYWEVWQQQRQPGRIVAHLSLGAGGQPVSKPRCSAVRALARSVGATGHLAASQRPFLGEAKFATKPVWTSPVKGKGVPEKLKSGVIGGSVEVGVPDRYGFWMSGIFDRRVQLLLDGKPVDKARREFNFSFPRYIFMGTSRLSKGTHSLELHYGDEGDLHPGTGAKAAVSPSIGARRVLFGFGPILFGRASPGWQVTPVKPSQAPRLCGKRLDWLEAIVPAPGGASVNSG